MHSWGFALREGVFAETKEGIRSTTLSSAHLYLGRSPSTSHGSSNDATAGFVLRENF